MKIFILLALITTFLFSSERTIETKIYKLIIHSVFPQKKEIKIWTNDPQKNNSLKDISWIKIVKEPQNADLLILLDPIKSPYKALIFTSSYRALKHYKKSAIGGFYWQKGRPNILFLETNLDKHNIKLPNSMNEYVESSI